MNISYREKIAILYAISVVACADSDFSKEESILRSKVAIFLGVTNDDNMAIASMELKESCRIMSTMSYENKKFASAVLMQMMMVDGVDLQIEHRVIDIVSQLANLPSVSPNEAYNYLRTIGIIGNKAQLVVGALRYGAN